MYLIKRHDYLLKLNTWLEENRNRENPDFNEFKALRKEIKKEGWDIYKFSTINIYDQNIFKILLEAGFDFTEKASNAWCLNMNLKNSPSYFVTTYMHLNQNRSYCFFLFVYTRANETERKIYEWLSNRYFLVGD